MSSWVWAPVPHKKASNFWRVRLSGYDLRARNGLLTLASTYIQYMCMYELVCILYYEQHNMHTRVRRMHTIIN